MAKILFGGGPADFTVSKQTVDGTADVLVLATVISLVAFDGGDVGANQVLDLALFNGSWTTPGSAAVGGAFTSGANGTFLVWAEDTTDYLFVAAASDTTTRWIMHPVNIQSKLKTLVASIGTLVADAVAALKGVANGVASLDIDSKIPIAQILVGTAAGTVMAGNAVLTLANVPAGYIHVQVWDGVGTTPNRASARTDIRVWWWSPVEPSYAAGKAINGTDLWLNVNP